MTNDQQSWTVSDVLEATGGRMLSGDQGVRFEGICTDSRTAQAGDLFVAIPGENFDGHNFLQEAFKQDALGVVVAEDYMAKQSFVPDGDKFWIAVPDTLRALGDLAAFRRRNSDVSVVAITGTNGKTTTKEMTASVLGETFSVLKTPGNFNNLVGLPLTLFGLSESHEWAVVEVAMNHPGEIRRLTEISDPDLGVITNVQPGHLEGVRDIDGVMAAKGELLEGLGEESTAVLNVDDERVCQLAEGYGGRVVTFGIHSSAEVWGAPVSQTRSGSSFDLSWYEETVRIFLEIPGLGAIYNALAAAAVGYRAGLSIEEVKKGLESTVPLPGRMQVSTLPGGIHLIDDTYNANPGSVSVAIETLGSLKGNGRGVFVIGGMMELGDHAQSAHKQIGVMAARAGLSGLYITGDFADHVAEGASGAGMDRGQIFVGSREEIVEALKDRLGPGDWLLVKGSRLTEMEKVVNELKTEN
ncbi:MAG: UDP-N-acetylmuramoyl-tripeptide--D-alanyl-D-alanine ligase [Deltaproteobacteria bacterium]|nr:UDP-N-acetylmuramoyl-tripeptide--D-alanyl-D-alanine ligase [Deltaproteobacteria bacterium]